MKSSLFLALSKYEISKKYTVDLVKIQVNYAN